MLVGMAGGILLAPGDEADFAEAEAIRLIEAGFAVPVVIDKLERTVRKPITERRAQ